jgi:hypothetical protein
MHARPRWSVHGLQMIRDFRPIGTDAREPYNREQLIQNQLFDRGVRGILQITQRKQQSGSSALNKEG